MVPSTSNKTLSQPKLTKFTDSYIFPQLSLDELTHVVLVIYHSNDQSHHTPRPHTSCSRAVLNKNRMSTHGIHTGPLWCRWNFASYGACRVLTHALQAYGPRMVLELINSPWTARKGPVRPNMMPVRDFYKFQILSLIYSELCQFSYVFVRVPYGTLADHARAPYGSRGIWKTLDFSVRGPYNAHTGGEGEGGGGGGGGGGGLLMRSFSHIRYSMKHVYNDDDLVIRWWV